MKKSLITGINGQDGSYLAEFLLKKKYIIKYPKIFPKLTEVKSKIEF